MKTLLYFSLCFACVELIFIAPTSAMGGEQTRSISLADCRIKAADQVILSANQPGAIKWIPQEGDLVKVGERLILIDDELALVSLAVAEKQALNQIDIRYSEAASEVARLEYEQSLEVNASLKGSISVTEVRRRKLEFDRSLLQIEQSTHQQQVALLKRDEAAAQLKTFLVVAPFTGVVSRVLKRKGESARQGEPILELVNTRRVRVEGFVQVAERHLIRPGTPVQVDCENGTVTDSPHFATGKIVFVDTVVQPVTRRFRVWADVDNSDGALISGLTAKMVILPAVASTADTLVK